MADQVIQVQPDSTGKKVDCSELTVGTNTVERQRIVIADPTTAANLVAVANGALQVEEICSIAPGTAAPSQVEIVGGKSNDGTPQYQPVPLGPAGRAVVVEGNASGVALPVSWTSPTGVSAQQVQGTAADNAGSSGNPVWVAGDDGTTTRSLKTDAAGNLIVKDFSAEVTRTLLCIYCDDITGVASESVLSCSVNKAATVTTSQSSYTVTTGKTLRITGLSVYITGTTTTAAGVKVRIRQAASSVGTGSPVIASIASGMAAATATASGANNAQWENGIEVAAGQQICLTQLASSTSSKVSACLMGFEY